MHTWSLNETRIKKVDSFHRRLLRYAINMHWPKKISNGSLYQITKQVKWSESIHHRRLCWFGHLMRLPEDTPVRKALRDAEVETAMPRGRSKTTWIGTMKSQLNSVNLTWEEAKTLAKNREEWGLMTHKYRPQWA